MNVFVKKNFEKTKRHWDYVESLLAGNKKKMIEQMAVDGSFVAIFGDDQAIYEVENENEEEI